MKTKNIIILIITLSSLGLAFYSMKSFMTPYVSFTEAMESGEYSQVIGYLEKNSVNYTGNKILNFTLFDNDNRKLYVQYDKSVPVNFSHSEKVVAIGYFKKKKNIFLAEKLLFKCPSKYKVKTP